MKNYFIHNGQNEIGPFDFEQLRTMQLKSDTPIWYEGLHDWTIAGNIDELKEIINKSVQPPKFKNSTQQNYTANPPSFSRNQLSSTKKNNTLRTVLLGVGVVAALFIGLVIYASINSEQNNDEIPTNEYVAPAVEEDQLTLKNRNYRNSIEEYVGAHTNRYTYNELGGISNLDIIVTNNTEYLLNEVNVNVDYIKDNGEIYKSEIVTLYNIPAKQDKSVSAPESDRGTSVNAKIESILSKKLHMCYDNTVAPKVGDIDPYFCK